MSRLTDIKQKILQLDGGPFQELCDAYLSKRGYKGILSLGMKSGTTKTTKGIPDTYFLKSGNKYILVMYTTQQTNWFKKVSEDISDCLNPEKTKLEVSDIAEIIYCHTSDNLSAGEDKSLRERCVSNGVLLQLKGIDEIASDIYNHFHGIARDFLGIPISTEQIFNSNEFISVYDANTMAAPLSTTFQFREKEITEVLLKIEKANVTILSGLAGVGKTRLALECCQRYASTNGYRLCCIQSNRLPIYDDLKVFLDSPSKYLLMIDDANQITGLHHVLQYLTKQRQGYDVKIVITVRDYAKQTTIQDVREFSVPEICTISAFSDEEIKELLKVNLEILNSNYLDKIVKIAEGNARLAIIAGKLAVETQSLDSINDATQLYEGYYGKFLKDNIIDQERNLYTTAGIIAFLTAINLENLETLLPVLEEVGISEKSFVNYTHQLHELEIVDIYNDKAVKISDQCLGNYLLKFIFIKKRIIPFSNMVIACFGNYRPRVINAAYILGNIFASTEMNQQLEKEIGIVWDDFKRSNNPLFIEFVKAFYIIRPTETLLMLKEEIDTLAQETFDINTINFEQESRNNSVNNDILKIIGGFRDRKDLTVALDLLFKYYCKQPQRFMDCYHSINTFFSIQKDSQRFDYWTQIQLVSRFIEYADHWNNENVTILFLRIAAEFLKLHFSPAEAGRGKTIILYKIPVRLSDGSKQYRELIWTSLIDLYHNENYQSKIETIIKNYGHFLDMVDQELVQFDFQYILSFFNKLFSPSRLSHCIIAEKVSDLVKRDGIDATSKLESYLTCPDYELYCILKGKRHLEEFNWKKEKELKESDIRNLLEGCNQEKVFKIIQVCVDYDKYVPGNAWEIQEGLQYVYSCLSSNRELYLYAIDVYLECNTPINLFPDPIIIKLFEIVGDKTTFEIISRVEYNQKNSWQFSFYKNLPQEVISEQYVQSFYDFLAKDEGSITSSPYRNIDFLEKYKPYDSDIYIKASKIIINKYDYSPFMFSIYFGLMFNLYTNNLIEIYKNDWTLLKEIYFKLISYDSNEDHNGEFIITFAKYYPLIIDEYIELIVLKKRKSCIHVDENRLSAIWDCENYIELADKIVEKYCNCSELGSWQISSYIRNILKCQDKSGVLTGRQDSWISHYIDCNYGNVRLMRLLFSAINEISPECRKTHILHLIRLNADSELFINLEIEPISWGGTGSMIPYMEERIVFLKSLLPELSGLTYLKHKQRIERDIAIWQQRIEHEQIDEILVVR
ncbi:hypothetical protein [Desulfosporosinus sp. SB140]|uniref:hypothetical protein n=1 Tax=Desulfosporosinus paludis TaxID=3115649 RepID=UPI00388D0F0E